MKQGFLSKGQVKAYDVPPPRLEPGMVLIRTSYSCISVGTEITAVATSGKSIVSRAIEKPKKVTKVLRNISQEGLRKTIENIQDELEKSQAIGYSLAGQVIAKAENVQEFSIGDRVAAAGGAFAVHAEIVAVPQNLVVKIPPTVSAADASTVALGAIALQGVRRCQLQVGEFAAVYGTGFIGLLALQILHSAGIRVIAIDINDQRLELAAKLGAELTIHAGRENVVQRSLNFTGGYGVDATLFAASTNDSKPLSESFQICRRKGKVVLLGVAGMHINRKDIYQKELDFLISTSYGPGRYDNSYEVEGFDYPYGYVRWTENRNMQAYLHMLSSKRLDLSQFSVSEFKIDEIRSAFAALQSKEARSDITLLSYPNDLDHQKALHIQPEKFQVDRSRVLDKKKIGVALVGAGQYAHNFHLPNLKSLKSQCNLIAVASRTALSAKSAAEKFNAKYYTTDYTEILADPEIDLVIIATRHDSHANLTLSALKAGKHVFVEKPLATNRLDLQETISFFENKTEPPRLSVGFNRRFSPHVKVIKSIVDKRINPLMLNYRINAGRIPQEHWVHKNGGRIVGEACHFIDLAVYLIDSNLEDVHFEKLRPQNDMYTNSDNVSILMKFQDGSVASIQYISTGSKQLTKEYLEIHCDGQSISLHDFKDLNIYGSATETSSSKKMEKGQFEQLQAFFKSLYDPKMEDTIPLWQLFLTTSIALQVSEETTF